MYPSPVFPCSEEQIDAQAVPRAMQEILNRILEAYATAGLTPPARQLWAAGEVTEECDQLAVKLLEIQPDDQNDTTNCDSAMRATINISVTRCVPVTRSKTSDRPPSPEQLQTSGSLIGTDAWLLAKIACRLDLYGMGGLEEGVDIEEPNGGMQTTTLRISPIL